MLTEKEVAGLRNKWKQILGMDWNHPANQIMANAFHGNLHEIFDTLEACFKVVKTQKKIMSSWYYGNPLGEILWKEAREGLLPFQEPRESEGK